MGGRMPLLPFGWVGCMFTRQGYLAFFPYVVIPASFRGRTSIFLFLYDSEAGTWTCHLQHVVT